MGLTGTEIQTAPACEDVSLKPDTSTVLRKENPSITHERDVSCLQSFWVDVLRDLNPHVGRVSALVWCT